MKYMSSEHMHQYVNENMTIVVYDANACHCVMCVCCVYLFNFQQYIHSSEVIATTHLLFFRWFYFCCWCCCYCGCSVLKIKFIWHNSSLSLSPDIKCTLNCFRCLSLSFFFLLCAIQSKLQTFWHLPISLRGVEINRQIIINFRPFEFLLCFFSSYHYDMAHFLFKWSFFPQISSFPAKKIWFEINDESINYREIQRNSVQIICLTKSVTKSRNVHASSCSSIHKLVWRIYHTCHINIRV